MFLGGTNGAGGESGDDYSKEAMEKFTEEEKKQYNEYWSYYYGTEYHDYYGDCLAQFAATEGQIVEGEGQVKGQGQKEETEGEEKEGEKKKGKKRKGGAQQKRPEGLSITRLFYYKQMEMYQNIL